MTLDLAAVVAWMSLYGAQLEVHKQHLIELDSQIGDGDHGANMDRGFKKVVELDPVAFASPSDYLKKVGLTLISTVGGASGPLYGTFFLRLAQTWPGAGSDEPAAQTDETAALGVALRAGLVGVQERGKAVEGDKTMVDALAPAVAAYELAAGQGLAVALRAAADAAAAGRDATIPLVARKGRASYLGERSSGHQDPGATSLALLFETACQALGGDRA